MAYIKMKNSDDCMVMFMCDFVVCGEVMKGLRCKITSHAFPFPLPLPLPYKTTALPTLQPNPFFPFTSTPSQHSVLSQPQPPSNVPAYNVALDGFGLCAIGVERLPQHASVEEAICAGEQGTNQYKKTGAVRVGKVR